MTYNDIWRRLAKVYPDDEAKAISRLLMEDLFGLSLSDIICGAADRLSDDSCRVLEEAVQRLERSEPLQYVTGKALFCDRLFHVEPGVLIPRPETEQLCRLVVEGIKDVSHPDILDIGTGSGCIATTLSLDIPEARLSAWDISDKALSIAAANAEALGARVCFSKQDALNAPDDKEDGTPSSATLHISATGRRRIWRGTFSTTSLISHSSCQTATPYSSTAAFQDMQQSHSEMADCSSSKSTSTTPTTPPLCYRG